MRFYIITHDKQQIRTQTMYTTLRSAFVAYEALIYDINVQQAMLLVNEYGVPLASFNRYDEKNDKLSANI